jgi:hypothetical protein
LLAGRHLREKQPKDGGQGGHGRKSENQKKINPKPAFASLYSVLRLFSLIKFIIISTQ